MTRLVVLLIAVMLSGPASAHYGKAQANASTPSHRRSHSWSAPVFFGYGADRRRALRDEYCRKQFNERRGVRPDMPMGC